MLSVSPEFLGVSSLPVGAHGGSGLDSLVALVPESSGVLAHGGETSPLSVVVLGGADPVDAGVLADGGVAGVYHDNFVEFETGILTNPVGGEHSEVGAFPSNTLFGLVSVGSLFLELVDSLVHGLSKDGSLAHQPLAATSADADSVHDKALLSLVSESACLVGAGRSGALVDHGELSELPGSHSEHETDQVRLKGVFEVGQLEKTV